jgi:hypothetical protein
MTVRLILHRMGMRSVDADDFPAPQSGRISKPNEEGLFLGKSQSSCSPRPMDRMTSRSNRPHRKRDSSGRTPSRAFGTRPGRRTYSISLVGSTADCKKQLSRRPAGVRAVIAGVRNSDFARQDSTFDSSNPRPAARPCDCAFIELELDPRGRRLTERRV